MIGRLVHYKGFDLAIEAFSRVSTKFPNVKLVIVGSGPEKKRLHEMAKDLFDRRSIVFTGFLPRVKVLRLLGQADIFLIPSMKEAGTWVLFEAMACGLPIVCLDYGGPAEIVDETCSIMIPVGQRVEVIRGIAAALDKLLSRKVLREKMGKASIDKLEADFLWEGKREILNKLYQNALKKAE
jgi:glycosyltransferase involved in cell wall biosynthesis